MHSSKHRSFVAFFSRVYILGSEAAALALSAWAAASVAEDWFRATFNTVFETTAVSTSIATGT
jgi:hypothetical protein